LPWARTGAGLAADGKPYFELDRWDDACARQPLALRVMQQRCETVGRSANFRAIKESSGDINRLHMQATRYPNLAISCDMDDTVRTLKQTIAGILAEARYGQVWA
jgi:hypothetical protein